MGPEVQIRFSLATAFKDKTVEELEALFQWVMGPKQSIVPVSSFEVKKV